MKTIGRRLAAWLLLVILCLMALILGGCSSSSTSSYTSSYTSKEAAYDAKYGAGAYAADKALLDSMRDTYNAATGN